MTNQGDDRWPWGEHTTPLIRLGYRWRHSGSDEPILEGRALFTETVKPGQTTRLLVGIHTPATPGDYVLEADVVHEHLRWFGCETRLAVTLEPAQSGAGLLHPWLAWGEMAPTTSPREQAHLHAQLRKARSDAAQARSQLAMLAGSSRATRGGGALRLVAVARRLSAFVGTRVRGWRFS